MSTAKTAKLLNDLLASQKADRARIKLLEERLATADSRQAAALTATAADFALQTKTRLDLQLQVRATEDAAFMERLTHKDQLIDNLNWQITALQQELGGARLLLSAADASNVELRGLIEALGDKLDKASQASEALTDERAEVAKQREALQRLLDDVRSRMRRKDLELESAILNRQVLAGATPKVNYK